MPTVKFTAAKQLELDKARVLSVLEARLPRDGYDVAKLRAFLLEVGMDLDVAALASVRDALVADGVITIA